jgi:histone H3/H4
MNPLPSYSSGLIETPDILLQPVRSSGSGVGAPYFRAHSLPTTSPALNHQHSMAGASPALNHQHSMDSASSPAMNHQHSMDSAASSLSHHSHTPPAMSASNGQQQNGASANMPPPGLELYMQQQYPSHFKANLSSIDLHDYKTNKHQLPLARIKKIMKSDEDVRMISAEAPVLFAKACELFILDLSLRAWAHVEHASPQGGPKRRTMQRNDVAAAIANSELFDFLYQIVPVGSHNPDEEGTPPRANMSSNMSDGEQRSVPTTTPDVLLERPLHDPYDDALPPPPPPVHATRTHLPRAASSAYHRSALASSSSSASAAAQAAAQVAANMSDDSPLSLHLASPSGSNDYGMTSMSRGVSLEPVGITTPVFGLPLELMPEPETPGAGGQGNMMQETTGGGQGVMSSAMPAPPTPSQYFHGGAGMMPNTPFPSQQFVPSTPQSAQFLANTPANATWMDGPASPVTGSTPSSNSLSVNTPNFQSGYSAEGSVEEDETE